MLNAGVIGIGAMGRNHVRVLGELAETNLAAVADTDEAAVNQVARTYKAHPYTDYRQMLDREALDFVVVAVPTRLHLPIALAVLNAGCHLFVEKPIAGSTQEAATIIHRASCLERKLTVGHIERFNPAVLELKRRLDEGQLGRMFQVHARRVGPFPARVADVGVIFDLATHELNIMEYLTGSRIATLFAQTEQEIHANHEDLLSGLLRFQSGVVGVLDINWLTPTKIRELMMIGERGMFLVNYLKQDLLFFENNYTKGQWEGAMALMGVSEGRRIQYEVQRKEPLRAELEAFANAIIDNHAPLVSGDEAMRAVSLAQALIDSGRLGQIIHMGAKNNQTSATE